ncbi:polysaccharide deacetylase family protein [Bhargavaea massiliensis]|uniref:polysaccharide deacetylase family protein n=1 Tax=Bhargavaea massiliensis TaxID=2697500 RepID=UPI001BCFF7F8
MIKRLKFPAWVVIGTAMILIVAGVIQLSGSADLRKSAETVTTISKYPGLDLHTLTKETDHYTYSISQPETEHQVINESIDRWINRETEAFLKEVGKYKEDPDDSMRGHLNIQVETNRMSEHFYSLVFRSYSITGGANGQNKVNVFNLDMSNGRLLELGDVLELDGESIEQIKEIIWEGLQSNHEWQLYVDQTLFNEVMGNPDNWKWSIDNEHFTLYWDEYEIAAGAAGEVELDVPVEKIAVFLKKSIQSYLAMPEEKVRELDAIREREQLKLDPDGKYIALTFDDGPSATVTPKILRALKEHNAKATFFMLGSQAEYYPGLVREVAGAGHEIGNHSGSHPDLSKADAAKILDEIAGTTKRIKDAAGVDVNHFRPPYGAYNEGVIDYMNETGQSIILWSVDSLDWKHRDPDTIRQTILQQASPGAIVLMHDIHPTTADSLPGLLSALEQEGYEFVTVSQLLEWKGQAGVGPYFGSR